MLVGVLMYLALAHPVGFFIVLALLIALAIWMLPRFMRALRAMIEKIRCWFGGVAGRPDAGKPR
jgi:hypothetical protein